MNRVELEISDPKKYQDVAFLVDRDDFLADISIVKKEIERSGKTKSYSDSLLLFFSPELWQPAFNIIRKYKYPSGFVEAVLAAIIKKVVTDEDMLRCYSKVNTGAIFLTEPLSLNPATDDIVLILNKKTIKGNKEKILREISSEIDNIAKTLLINRRELLSDKHPLNQDIKPEIKKAREWYWLNKQGMSYQKIYKKLIQGGHSTSIDNVTSHIQNYKSLLLWNP